MKKPVHHAILSILILLICATLAACSAAATPTAQPTAAQPTAAPTQPEPTATVTAIPPTETPAPAATFTPSGPVCMAGDPQEITFTASDGYELSGRYYPPAQEGAPLVVLMHWVDGSMDDWNEIAIWLQNRGIPNPYPQKSGGWQDPSWFPAVPADQAYGVLTFTFRKCEAGACAGFHQDEWLLDVEAAMQKAATLQCIDPNRIVTIGASIGADGAIYGCLAANRSNPGACPGALSLSPGGFLGIRYRQNVKDLQEANPDARAWCFADSQEISTCQNAEEYGTVTSMEFVRGHGMALLQKSVTPSALENMLLFLRTILE